MRKIGERLRLAWMILRNRDNGVIVRDAEGTCVNAWDGDVVIMMMACGLALEKNGYKTEALKGAIRDIARQVEGQNQD